MKCNLDKSRIWGIIWEYVIVFYCYVYLNWSWRVIYRKNYVFWGNHIQIVGHYRVWRPKNVILKIQVNTNTNTFYRHAPAAQTQNDLFFTDGMEIPKKFYVCFDLWIIWLLSVTVINLTDDLFRFRMVEIEYWAMIRINVKGHQHTLI